MSRRLPSTWPEPRRSARGLQVTWVVADLDDYRVPDGAFDVITVIRYVNRRCGPD